MTEGPVADNSTDSHRTVSGQRVDTSQWATPDEGAFEGPRRALYLARKQAVDLYLSGANDETIKQLTSIGAKQAYRLIRERCLETHPDGRPYGWRALVPYLRIRPYKRRTIIRVDRFGGGAVGALQALLDGEPELRKAFDSRIRANTSDKRLIEIGRSRRRHCSWFLDQLRSLGYEARNEWPFNTLSQGYFSIRRYADSVLLNSPTSLAAQIGGPSLVAKLKTGDGTDRPVMKFMQRVEMDAHKLDGRFCVSLPLMGGGSQEKIVHRLWVIVLLEVVSRAVVGYYLSMRREVSKDDVLRAVKRGLSRWNTRPISFCQISYLPGAGLLSAAGNEFTGLCWDETSVDGALAETCQQVREALRDAVGSTLLDPKTSFSKRRSKDDRPFIETFFRNLAGQGFQRLSNTTGAKPQDRRGRAPEEIALSSRFQYEYAEELLDLLIANYNVTPHRGIGNRTPLAYARYLYAQSGAPLRRTDATVIESLFSTRKRCVVRGGAKTGRAPFVEFHYARYTNEVLHNRHDLVGTEIWVISHKEDDCRIALASTLQGMSLGVLRAAPPWHISPHSLAMRAAICQASSRGQLVIPAGCDGVGVFIDYVERQPRNKLPVHPAYLEARRILIAAAEQSIGSSMLESAMTRASASEAQRWSKGMDDTKETDNPLPSAAPSGETERAATHGLPPRRLASAR
ncbi:hypothetical protein PQQ51_33995 [Paraburkholderia xenovorans]|uniref:hypothetical protein n=1 Tax=Paraburkholderia xenovorans TaxID=36873 RepID=UPI0038B99884